MSDGKATGDLGENGELGVKIAEDEADCLARNRKKIRQDAEEEMVPGVQPSQSYRDKVLNLDGQSMQAKERGCSAMEAPWKEYLEDLNSFYARLDKEKQSESSRVEGGRRSNLYPRLQVTREEYEAWCAPWRKSLIIKLLGMSISIHKLRPKLEYMWKMENPFKLLDLDNDYFITSFETNADLEYVLMDGPWMVADHYVMVQRWRPNFNPWAADNQRRIAAWVKIRSIPMEFYNYESLWRLEGLIGRMLKVDLVTSLSSRGRFACVCVELDLQLQLLPALEIFSRTFYLEYEGLHLVCFECGMFGHRKEECSIWCEKQRERDRGSVSIGHGKNTSKEAVLNKGGRVNSMESGAGVREETGNRGREGEGEGTSASPRKVTSPEMELFQPRMLVRLSLPRQGGNGRDHGLRASISARSKKLNDSRDLMIMGAKSGYETVGRFRRIAWVAWERKVFSA